MEKQSSTMIKSQYNLIISILLFQFLPVHSQKNNPDYYYQELIAKAGLYHLQKDYVKAIPIYKQAFAAQKPDALNAYKAAGVFALADDIQQAVDYLQFSIDSGWTEADFLVNDPYFIAIPTASMELWNQIKNKAYAAELHYVSGLSAPELRSMINQMMIKDQLLRYKRAQLTVQSEIDKINLEINQADQENLEQAKLVLSKFGWPKLSAVGKDGANNFWLVVQHADNDIIFQRLALKEMKKLMIGREINLENYAFLYDRVQCNLNYKQTYGTQVVWTSMGEASGYRPIWREDQVDSRRKKMGLLPLRIYALNYGFNYTPVQKHAAISRDADDILQASKLTDSITYYYRNKQFDKAYQAADRAAMIAGGMSDKQNLQAAMLFAAITDHDKDAKYKSIALDFLYLTAIRGKLTKRSLLVTNFNALKTEQRWIEIEKLAH